MEKTNNKTAGLFIFIGISLFILVLFLVGGKNNLFSSTYHLNASFKDAQGLNVGSVVQLSGISVGNIYDITFDSKGDLIVILEIQKEYQKRITEGSVATLRTQGALGDKFVYIKPGPLENTSLKDKQNIAIEKGTDIFSALSNNGDQIQYIFEILKDTRDLIKDIKGDGELKQSILNISSASKNLNQFSNEFSANHSGKELNQSIKNLNQILTRIDNGSGTLGAIINDPSLYNKINQWLGGKDINPIKSAIRDSIKEREN